MGKSILYLPDGEVLKRELFLPLKLAARDREVARGARGRVWESGHLH